MQQPATNNPMTYNLDRPNANTHRTSWSFSIDSALLCSAMLCSGAMATRPRKEYREPSDCGRMSRAKFPRGRRVPSVKLSLHFHSSDSENLLENGTWQTVASRLLRGECVGHRVGGCALGWKRAHVHHRMQNRSSSSETRASLGFPYIIRIQLWSVVLQSMNGLCGYLASMKLEEVPVCTWPPVHSG
jgi:hypothetical protein